jgi:hypothetical protein
MFVLLGLGGVWVSLEVTGDGFQKVTYLTPLAWSMTGFRKIFEKSMFRISSFACYNRFCIYLNCSWFGRLAILI